MVFESGFFVPDVQEYCKQGNSSTGGITEQVNDGKACPDKHTEKFYISNTQYVDYVDILQELHQKSKQHYPDSG